MMGGLATSGPLARTVADAAALLDVMSGAELGDLYALPDPEPSFRAMASRPPGTLRIGFAPKIQAHRPTDAANQEAVLATAKRLETLGHSIEEVTWINLDDLEGPFTILWQAVTDQTGVPGLVMEKFNRWLLGRAKRVGCGAYLRAWEQVYRMARQIIEFCQPYDVMLLPVYSHPTIRVGQWAKLRPKQTLAKVIEWVLPCPPFNASGQPSIAIPTGFDPQGLPIGVQLVGHPGAEATIIALAAQLEGIDPWYNRKPALALNLDTDAP
jgi:amidase